MDLSFILGIVGSVIVAIGALYPLEKVKRPVMSIKNRLFAIGSFVLLFYAITGYLAGGPVFFIFLEIFVMVAVLLMFLNIKDRTDTWIISLLGIALLVYSYFFFHGPSMFLFIIAFIVLWLGYAYDMNTVRRFVWLTVGGALIALSSYLDASRIFFWLNVFFALASLVYLIVLINRWGKKAPAKKAVAVKKKVVTKKKVIKKKK